MECAGNQTRQAQAAVKPMMDRQVAKLLIILTAERVDQCARLMPGGTSMKAFSTDDSGSFP
jgi:hypothetical protein